MFNIKKKFQNITLTESVLLQRHNFSRLKVQSLLIAVLLIADYCYSKYINRWMKKNQSFQ